MTVLVVTGAAGCGINDTPPVAAPSAATTVAAVEAATPPAPAATATPAPAFTTPKPMTIPNGGTLPTDNGLLYIDAASGAMTFWDLGGAYIARPISHDGRWVVWGRAGVAGSHLFDTETGADREPTLDGQPASALGISEDGSLLVLLTAEHVALVRTATGAVLEKRPTPVLPANGAPQFAADGTASEGFEGDGGKRTTILLRVNGTGASLDDVSWPMMWSHDSSRLAATSAQGVVVFSADGTRTLGIDLGRKPAGSNLRWSPDDGYIAVANTYDVGGARVFDAATGREVLRIEGTPTCLGDYWLADGSLRYGFDGKRVTVPGGAVTAGAAAVDGAVYEFDQSAPAGLTRLLLPGGRTASFRSSSWSWYYDGEGVMSQTTRGEALFLIGIGGKGLCDGQMGPPRVELPPFEVP